MESERLPRKLAAILYADIAGYSRATGADEDATHQILSQHLDGTSAVIEKCRGRVMHYAGDAVLATFAAAVDALRAATEMHSDVAARNSTLPAERRIEFRIGVNLGDVIEDRGDVYGNGVNVAARLAALAEPGGICISESVRVAVGQRLPLGYRDIGAQSLKNIGEPVRAYRVRSAAERTERDSRRFRYSRRSIARASVAGAVVLVASLVAVRWGDGVLGMANRAGKLVVRTAAAAPVRLAVLPLENLSADADQEFFADGMHDLLITDLAGIGALQVTARASALRYRGTDKTAAEIAQELNVDAIVTGSVTRSGDRVRVTTQLIDAATEEHLWTQRYDRPVREILTLQNEIVGAIVREVQQQLTAEEAEQLARARPVDPAAHETYLRGMYFLNQGTPAGIERGMALLHEAVDKDPSHPLPYAHLAAGYATLGHGPSPPPDAFGRARAAAVQALELDESVALAHAVLAELVLYAERTWDWPAAERAFQRAIELNPTLARAHAHYGWYFLLFHRGDEGLESMRRAQEVDPLNPLWPAWQGSMYWALGRYEEGIREAQKSLELNPTFPVGLQVLGYQYAAIGAAEQAVAAADRAAELAPPLIGELGGIYAFAGRHDDARRIAADVARAGGDPYGVAMTYAALGEADEMFRWLEAAYERRSAFLPWIGSFNRETLPYRTDARFVELLRRMNVPF